MIKGTFQYGGYYYEVIIKGNELLFSDTLTQKITPISGLSISKSGVLKEFPDLEDDEEWKQKAIQRLKEYMKKLKTEEEKLSYVRNELIKYGYIPLYKQRGGFRPVKF